MSAGLGYLDTSAFVKLSLGEAEQAPLRQALAAHDAHVASALLRTEAMRACARYGTTYVTAAERGLSTVALIPVDDDVLRHAGALTPPTLRSLDALHLATALSLGPDLGALFTYDQRMIEAARDHGVPVLSPA